MATPGAGLEQLDNIVLKLTKNEKSGQKTPISRPVLDRNVDFAGKSYEAFNQIPIDARRKVEMVTH